MTEHEDFITWVNTVLRDAEVAVHNGDAELMAAEVVGDVAYTACFEHTATSVDGVPRAYTVRATQIYRREHGQWMVAHRHGSAPPD
jgi:ketosteroid isomerase-like protein